MIKHLYIQIDTHTHVEHKIVVTAEETQIW